MVFICGQGLKEMSVVVTPPPHESDKDRAGKLWQKRQALQAVLTSLGLVRKQLDVYYDLECVVDNRLQDAQSLIQESMELLSPAPRVRVPLRGKSE